MSQIDSDLRRLIDANRATCLWFLREDYYPSTRLGIERVLRLIERHGDLEAFRQTAKIRAWLSRESNGTSARF